jgi:hypothetical protein
MNPSGGADTDPDLMAACTAVTFRRVRPPFFMTNQHVANGATGSHRLIKWQNGGARLAKDKVNAFTFEHPYCCFGSCHFRHMQSKVSGFGRSPHTKKR